MELSKKMLAEVSSLINQKAPLVNAYIAGGVAMSYWLGANMRQASDLDVFYSHRLPKPDIRPMAIEGANHKFSYDYNFNNAFSLIQANYPDRAETVCDIENLRVNVLAPVDLVIMKASSFTGKDRLDIKNLIDNKLIEKNIFLNLYDDAVIDYFGDPVSLETTKKKILEFFEKNENSSPEFPLS